MRVTSILDWSEGEVRLLAGEVLVGPGGEPFGRGDAVFLRVVEATDEERAGLEAAGYVIRDASPWTAAPPLDLRAWEASRGPYRGGFRRRRATRMGRRWRWSTIPGVREAERAHAAPKRTMATAPSPTT